MAPGTHYTAAFPEITIKYHGLDSRVKQGYSHVPIIWTVQTADGFRVALPTTLL